MGQDPEMTMENTKIKLGSHANVTIYPLSWGGLEPE